MSMGSITTQKKCLFSILNLSQIELKLQRVVFISTNHNCLLRKIYIYPTFFYQIFNITYIHPQYNDTAFQTSSVETRLYKIIIATNVFEHLRKLCSKLGYDCRPTKMARFSCETRSYGTEV